MCSVNNRGGKLSSCQRIILPDAQVKRETEAMCGPEKRRDINSSAIKMKEAISKEYLRKTRKIPKSTLNGGNKRRSQALFPTSFLSGQHEGKRAWEQGLQWDHCECKGG